MPSPTQQFGEAMEALAAKILEQRGYRILERHFRDGHGELDLIAEDHGTLVFCEVKARHSLRHGLPGEAIDRRKQEKIGRTAQSYLERHPEWQSGPVRFDAVLLQPKGEHWQVEVVQDCIRPGW